ncbi:MAG: hypothetical protein J5598_04215 [Clostridia bacterium]|nr:hypothetical protein [Clostridia bacterium]
MGLKKCWVLWKWRAEVGLGKAILIKGGAKWWLAVKAIAAVTVRERQWALLVVTLIILIIAV